MGLRLDGRPEGSTLGMTMWVTMIWSTPAWIAASNDGKFVASSWAKVWSEVVTPVSGLVLVSPRPGKCLAVAATVPGPW